MPFLPLVLAAFAWQAPQTASVAGATDDELRRAWGFMTDAERRETALALEGLTGEIDGLARSLREHARSLGDVDPGLLPEAQPAPFYDPKVHAPGQPIPRVRLTADAPTARTQRELFLKRAPKTGLDPAFVYDWATGDVLRTGDPADPTRCFENALAGFAPGDDLVIAWVERALDRGAERKTLAAFAHAYTDRAGNVYPGLTLYDAWASGKELEMPDVDVLGLVHDLLDEWHRWRAPIPEPQHDEIYRVVGELYRRAHAYRVLRTALAWTYLSGSAPLPDGWVGHRLRLHGLWETAESSPRGLAERLPGAADLQDFLQSWSERFDKDGELVPRAATRQAELERCAARVRETLSSLVLATGALRRTERPAPPKGKTANSGG